MNNTNEVPLLHQVRSPEGHEGWQWMNGLTFYYNKDDVCDNADAKFLAMECGEITMRIQRLQMMARHRSEQVCATEPIILNFEEEKAQLQQNRDNDDDAR